MQSIVLQDTGELQRDRSRTFEDGRNMSLVTWEIFLGTCGMSGV
jgi:hypothetical protein